MPSSNVNNVWGKQSQTVELTVPSGQLCMVKRPDPQRLVTLGVLDQVDILTKLVDAKHVKRVKGQRPEDLAKAIDTQAIAKNPKLMVTVLTMADKVIEAVVVEPQVKRPLVRDEAGTPILVKTQEGEQEVELTYADRVEGQIYTDMIDFMDRMFIFQHAVGGNPDLASFREQFGSPTDSVADINEIPSSTV